MSTAREIIAGLPQTDKPITIDELIDRVAGLVCDPRSKTTLLAHVDQMQFDRNVDETIILLQNQRLLQDPFEILHPTSKPASWWRRILTWLGFASSHDAKDAADMLREMVDEKKAVVQARDHSTEEGEIIGGVHQFVKWDDIQYIVVLSVVPDEVPDDFKPIIRDRLVPMPSYLFRRPDEPGYYVYCHFYSRPEIAEKNTELAQLLLRLKDPWMRVTGVSTGTRFQLSNMDLVDLAEERDEPYAEVSESISARQVVESVEPQLDA